jgi:hypothetical protein
MAFDSITPVKLGQGAVGATPSIFYTVPANTRTFVKDIDICNTTAVDKLIRVYLVPSGDSAGTDNALFYDLTIPGNGTLQWTGSQILEVGDIIQAEADVVGCTLNASGGEAV